MHELLVTVLVASLVGSLHCVGMCGPLVGFVAGASAHGPGSTWAHAAYHAGRLLTYTTLGAVAGSVGAAFDLAGQASGWSRSAGLLAGGLIVLWGGILLAQALGMRGLQGLRLEPKASARGWFGQTLVRIGRKPPVWRSAALGLASTLLPCGWLYGFAVLAAGTGSPYAGAAVMATFWLGSVPALLGAGMGIRALASALGPRLSWIMPALFIVLGLLTVAQRGGFGLSDGAPRAELQQVGDGGG
jgi:uncharacterized protein